MAAISASPSPLQVWFLAARPKTLPAAVAPVLLGSALAYHMGHFYPLPAIAALLGALFLQIGSNFANDYFDFKHGADTAARQGPMRVTQAGLATPRAVQCAAASAFMLASLCGVFLVTVAGWPIAALGLASILAAIAYTGGPFPLGYNGLGELTVFLFFGLAAVMGTVYVETLTLTPLSAWLAVPMGLLAAAILDVNNLRDRNTDAVCGKHTLAVRFGSRFGKAFYATLLFSAFAIPPVLWAAGLLGPLAWLVLLALPLSVKPLKTVFKAEGQALNGALAGTARLLLAFALLLSVAVAF
jgi:1,4-dihydroxy-2-naphthoate octaprenyltransferase